MIINKRYNAFFLINSAFIENKKDKTILSKRQRIKFCLKNFSHKIYENRYLPHTNSRMNYCCATLHKSMVIDSTGNVFKCWNDIGNNDKIIFKLNKPKQKNILQEAKYYTQTEPLYDKKCIKCFLLFSCYGGCPQKNADTKKRDCDLAKYKPAKFLEALYLRRRNVSVNSSLSYSSHSPRILNGVISMFHGKSCCQSCSVWA